MNLAGQQAAAGTQLLPITCVNLRSSPDFLGASLFVEKGSEHCTAYFMNPFCVLADVTGD